MTGGSSTSRSVAAPAVGANAGGTTFLGPGGGVLANLFGIGTNVGPAGISFQDPTRPGQSAAFGQQFANQIFGPQSFGDIGNVLTGANLGEQFAPQLAQLGGQAALQAGQFGQDVLLPATQEGIETGFRTDIAPVAAEAQRLFQEEIAPGIAERFSQTGVQQSDFGAALAREGAGIASELGALQTQLDESAANRRLQTLGFAPDLLQQQAGLPLGAASNLLDLGAQFTLQGTEGGRQLEALGLLTGLTPQQTQRQGVSASREARGGLK